MLIRKSIFILVPFFAVVALFLIVLHLTTIDKNRAGNTPQNVNDNNKITGNMIDEFETIGAPLIINKYTPDKTWKLVETQHFRVYIPNDWRSKTWTDGSCTSIGISRPFPSNGQDWEIVIYCGEFPFEKALIHEANQQQWRVGIGSERTRRDIVLSKYSGVLLGQDTIVLNIIGMDVAPVIYFNVNYDIYSKIASTIEIF